jgi:hypothetical protein
LKTAGTSSRSAAARLKPLRIGYSRDETVRSGA